MGINENVKYNFLKKYIRNCKNVLNITFLPLLIILIIFGIFLFLDWFVSNPIRAAIIDRDVLYFIDETFHYWYAKILPYNPSIILNPTAKFVYITISGIFLYLFPFGIISLRIMNTFFSIGILFILYKLTKKLGFDDRFSILAMLITVTFPAYFILSISTLTEIMFCFFLLTAIYLVYSKKYILSVILIALLPLIRQEGILYLGIWSFFLIKKSKIKFIPLLFIPSFLWMLSNYLLLSHSFRYVFFPYAIISKGSFPPWALISPSQINFFTLFGYYPILILSIIGLILELSNRRCALIFACIFIHISFLFTLQVAGPFLMVGCFWRESRYIVPMAPLIAIYATDSVRAIYKNFIQKKIANYFLVSIMIIMILSLIYQTGQSQLFSKVTKDNLTVVQEANLKKIIAWLCEYLKKENIKNIYANGACMTHKFMRRIMIDLSLRINCYAIVDDFKVLDPVTLRIILNHKVEGIFFALDKEENDKFISNFNCRLIKQSFSPPMYFYLVEDPKEIDKNIDR